GDQRGLGALAALEQPFREVGALPELGDGDVDRADTGVQLAGPVAVALRHPVGAGLAPFGAADGVCVRGQQRVDHRLQQLPHQIRRRLSEGFTEQASRVDNVRSGHRDDSIREGCRRFLEGSHGDRAHVHDEADHRAVTPLCGTPLVHPEALRTWVRTAEVDAGKRPGVPTDVNERLAQLERENRELRRANEILKTSAVNSTRQRNSAWSLSAGVSKPRVFRGLEFSRAATVSRSAWVRSFMLTPLGKY